MSAFDEDAEIARVREVVEDWAQSVGRGDYARWLAHFTEDAVLMPPGHANVVGRAEIDSYVRNVVRPQHRFTYTDQHIECAGDLAVVASRFVTGDLDAKDVVLLRRGDDATWRIARVIYNLNTPA